MENICLVFIYIIFCVFFHFLWNNISSVLPLQTCIQQYTYVDNTIYLSRDIKAMKTYLTEETP